MSDDSSTVDTSDLDKRLAELLQLTQKDDPRDAIYACDRFNRDYPVSGQGWNIASHLALRINDPDASLRAIDRALQIDPERTDWLLQKAHALFVAGKRPEARALAIRMAGRLYPTADLSSAVGLLLTQLDLHEEASLLFSEAVKQAPDNGGHYYNLATSQRFLGKLDQAETNLDHAIRLNSSDAPAMALRSGLRRQTAEKNHVDELRSALQKSTPNPSNEVALRFALAKELEDLEHFAESFSELQGASDLRRQFINYEPADDLQIMARIQEVFPAERFPASDGHIDARPIFVIGMPRTGTTLVEKILGSHSAVLAAGELNNFALQLTSIAQASAMAPLRSRADLVAASAEIDFSSLGNAYLESCSEFTGENAHFVDKMPMNFLYAGLIRLALPKAKIIHVRRHPMDTCYAIYKTLFQGAYPYSYDLEELARYYIAYERLMQHWDTVMPGEMYRVSYEDLVTDSRGETERLLSHCGLSWEEQCLNFHEVDAWSTTASAAQVRQPIYSSSVGLWTNYAKELKPVADILTSAGIEFAPAGNDND